MSASSDPLFHRDRSCLLVIDVQQYFLDKLPAEDRVPLVARIGWLMRMARALGVPTIATAEDIAQDGPLVPELAALLPDGGKVFDKRIFGLAQQPDIRAAVEATGRDEHVLVGLETDVCICHSALGLLAAGYRVAVIADACGSPAPHHAAGLDRIRGGGAIVTTLKGITYEWVRDLATLAALKRDMDIVLPPGLTL
ncbi:MAG TPA: isochorismatase family protein [Candidatus Cybelea sp.]|nr:isochorismatase family protein [Candidatus Cybelea sp.]